jgi:hypothetical protein
MTAEHVSKPTANTHDDKRRSRLDSHDAAKASVAIASVSTAA